MIIKLLVVASFANFTVADPCRILANSFGPGVASYTHGRVCHGLFWVVSGGSLICPHSRSTLSWCPDRYPVLETEANSILAGSFRITPVLADEASSREALSLLAAGSTSGVSVISTHTTTAIPVGTTRQRRVFSIQRADMIPTPYPSPSTSLPSASTLMGVDNDRPETFQVTDGSSSIHIGVYDACRMMNSRSHETQDGLCHGLFWLDDDHTTFCMHTSTTASTCPAVRGREITLVQAVEYVNGLDDIQLPRETTSRPPDRPVRTVRPVRQAQSFLDEYIDGSRDLSYSFTEDASLIGDPTTPLHRQTWA
jgi:hypothetical protein